MPPPPHSHPDPNKLSELPRAGSGRGRGHGSDHGRQPDASESRNIAGENGGGGAPTACSMHRLRPTWSRVDAGRLSHVCPSIAFTPASVHCL